MVQGHGENFDTYWVWFSMPGHNGMDFAWPTANQTYGQPVIAAHDGKVQKVINHGERNTKGNGVYLENNYFFTVYWHLSKIVVSKDQIVKVGDVIGYVGNSGWVRPRPTEENPNAGAHLHFGLRLKKEDGTFANMDNGWRGYVDPAPYFADAKFYKQMKHIIIGKEQFLIDEKLKIAINIADEIEEKRLRDEGKITGYPEKRDSLSDDYFIYPGIEKNRWGDLLGFR